MVFTKAGLKFLAGLFFIFDFYKKIHKLTPVKNQMSNQKIKLWLLK